MSKVVVVDAVRSPFGRRGGGLSSMHSADLLGTVQRALVDRVGIDPQDIGQVVGGCVGQVGMQSFNVARTAWLTAGLPMQVPATTIDSQCGSSQQATNLATALVASGVVDAAMACGVEVMSRVPMGSALVKGLGRGIPKSYFERYELTSQFEGAERIAEKWGITRAETDQFGLTSQQRGAQAWAEGRFDGQIVTVDAPDLDDGGQATGTTHLVARDEGLRETSLDALAGLKVVGRQDGTGIHTAGTSSQISDGAAAVLLMTEAMAEARGLRPLAEVVDTCLVGTDPILMLTGPIDATHRLLGRSGLQMGDIDVVEINEAFASVVLAWQRELEPDPAIVNPNGGAIALGHPLGATGAGLMTKAVHELVRSGGEHALVTMCCGGGLGTGTILRRI